MKNITLSMPEDLIKAGRKYAQEHQTTLNALIRELLKKTVQKSSKKNSLDEWFEKMDKLNINSEGITWKREDLYDI